MSQQLDMSPNLHNNIPPHGSELGFEPGNLASKNEVQQFRSGDQYYNFPNGETPANHAKVSTNGVELEPNSAQVPGGSFWDQYSTSNHNRERYLHEDIIPANEANILDLGLLDSAPLDIGTPLVNHLSAETLVPPLNFSLVEDSIYRSGFPMPINYPFLQQLRLKTIIYLGDLGNEKCDKPGKKKDKHGTAQIMNNYQEWLSTTDIKFHKLLFDSPQEPFIQMDKQLQAQKSLTIALQLLLDKNNFPILIHSNKGKHRIGVLVGLMRKILQGWCMSGIFEEYENFAMGKSEYDLEFIELWQPELLVDDNTKPDFVRI